MGGLIIIGLFFMFLGFVWVIYLAPKATRARQEEVWRRIREREEVEDDEPGEQGDPGQE